MKNNSHNTISINVFSRFLLISLPLCIIVFVLVISIFEVVKYKKEHSALKTKLATLCATYSMVLSEPLSTGNAQGLDLYTIALLSDPDVSLVEIMNVNNQVIYRSGGEEYIHATKYQQAIDITYLDRFEPKILGKLIIGVSNKRITSQLNQTLVNDFILLVALLCAVSLGIYIAFVRSVGKPLQLLVGAISQYKENRQHYCILYKYNDEFGEVITAYNNMQRNQIELNKEINEYQEMLVKEIKETKILQVKLAYEASHDALTDLYNRRTFDRKLIELLGHAKRHNQEGAIILMDLDRFKVVNDTCGHMAGDDLLQKLSKIMAGVVGSNGILARLGGDEFAVITENMNVENSIIIAEKIRLKIKNYEFSCQGKTFEIGVSIGLVPFNKNSIDIHHLMRTADNACYEAKNQGRNRIKIYQEDDFELVGNFFESEMVTTITNALKNNRFELWYQPLVPLKNEIKRQNKGRRYFEILLRMRDKNYNLISPAEFFPTVEHFGLATRVDRWVVDKAFDFLNSNEDIMQDTNCCLINLSGLSVGDEEFCDFLMDKANSALFPLSKICFEITESAAIINISKARKFILALQALGFKFALDDFGSGMSSFEYLKSLPVDILKIDGSFIKGITKNPDDASIVKAMIQMGRIMGKETVAEFVEDEATYQKLQEMNIDYAQGYHLGKPRSLVHMDDSWALFQ